MEMTYDGALVMPKSFAAVSEEEMTYVEGGGTITVTIKKSTIQGIIGLLGGAVSSYAIQLALDALGGLLVAPIEFGTAGGATLAVAAFLVMWNGAAAAIASGIMGGVVGMGASKIYTGGDITKSFSAAILPNISKSI